MEQADPDDTSAHRLDALRDLHRRIGQLSDREPAVLLCLATAERRVTAGEPAAGTLDEPNRWFEDVRSLLDDAGAVLGSPCGSITQARLTIDAAERELLQVMARQRAESARRQRREAILEEARRQLSQLGDDDPDEVIRTAGLTAGPDDGASFAVAADERLSAAAGADVATVAATGAPAADTGPDEPADPGGRTALAEVSPTSTATVEGLPGGLPTAVAAPDSPQTPATYNPAPGPVAFSPVVLGPVQPAAPAQRQTPAVTADPDAVSPAPAAVAQYAPAAPATPPGGVAPEASTAAADVDLPEAEEHLRAHESATWPLVVADLIDQGREDLAWLTAEADDQSRARQRTLAFFTAAMRCDLDNLESSLPADLMEEPEGMDEAAVLLAACLRFGLSAGYSPVGLPRLVERADIQHEPLRAVVAVAVEAVKHGGRRASADDGGYDELLKQWAALAPQATSLKETLSRANVVFPRASNVLHHLVRDNERLGRALADLALLAAAGPSAATGGDPRLDELKDVVHILGNSATVNALITAADQALSSPQQLKQPIQAKARTRLLQLVDEVRRLLAHGLAVAARLRQARRPADLFDMDALRRAGESYVPPPAPRTLGEAALHRLALWIRQDPAPTGPCSLQEVRRRALRLVYEVDQDVNGDPTHPLRPEHLYGALHGRTVEEAVRGYLDRGNVRAARELLGDEESDIVERYADTLNRAHNAAVKATDVAIAKLRSLGSDELARSLESELDDWRIAPVDRYDLARAPLAEMGARAARAMTEYRAELESRLAVLAAPRDDIERIRRVLDRNDEVTAEEFITKLKSGEPLPEAVSVGRRGDFDEFFPAVVEHAAETAAKAGPHERPEEAVLQSIIDLAGGQQPQVGSLREGLSSWKQLYQLYYTRKRDNKGEIRFRNALADVLRMLGLNPLSSNNSFQDVTDAPRTRIAAYEVRARPLDSSYVPQLGTQANGRYTVILVFERSTTPGRLLDLVPERGRTSAHLILYFGIMSVEQRLKLRQHSIPTSGKGSPTLVIDEAVIGWLATRQEAGFQATQEVTLPFTSINPYTPFAGGDVPSEVFVGREREREAVERALGSMFVYGGRQLGKSALLRRIEKLYTEPLVRGRTGRRVALYLDLKSESIGEARKPEELWTLLIRPLSQLGVLPDGRHILPDRVSQLIGEWLDRDEANSLLLLLDEADMFLAADAAPDENGRGQFRTFQRLKNLMERYGRRFKPVFAGLHQVQRFYDLSNTPVAHGGADILIGPLRPLEVRELVERPMRAIGYDFESDDLVWRIAALTNYQASLVQIFCEALIDNLQRRTVRRAGRIVITSEDVDGVYANRAVRDLIAQRFRWTINLDTRYRVIALVVTVLSLEDGQPGSTFSVDDLRTYCAASWPKGFAEDELRGKDFVRYLDEMVGLGVLHRSGEHYGIRSPNVVALLGTKKALDQELREASTHFELPYEYNPNMSRMVVGKEWERSPLTDADLADLIGEKEDKARNLSRVRRAGRQYKVAVVTGTPALGIDRVGAVLHRMAEQQQLDLIPVPLAELHQHFEDGKKHRLLLVEADHRADVDLAGTLLDIGAWIRERLTVRVIVVARLRTAAPLAVPAGDAFLHVRLGRWPMEALRAWHDFPFETVALRRRVHELTSGWPMLLERAAEQVNSGRSTDDVLGGLRHPFSTPEQATRFLDDVGIDERLRPVARAWAENSSDPGDERHMVAFTRADLEPVLGEAGVFLDRMQLLDVAHTTEAGWVLDGVVAEALTVAG
ncbi:hypothetical protein AB0H83_21715 [Dactylosporangium sp. NPDC050688]|uniref:hypothetical protein n=1 Tax=Dactylosporangium sp. NPDC050688 TaxID=3157217 RepID=UPI003401B4D6